jgi:catechol 2,3-dioxygenase-like lactoylglutathione lyase family enzyme
MEDIRMAEVEATKTAANVFEGVTPILRVRSLSTSIDYYVNVLGFRLDWEDPGIFASVSRDRCSVFLCEGDQGNPGTWLWIGVGDVESLYEDYHSKGARVRHQPTNYPWAYEMQIEDPDGHVLRFGSEPKTDQPIGEWLDMHGDRWVKSPNGGWTQLR